MRLQCGNCGLIFDEDDLRPQYPVNDMTQDPPEACCPGCGEVFEGEEIEEEDDD